MELEVRIERLGAQGDGVAQGPDGPLFVPFTLPGERVQVAIEPDKDHAEPTVNLSGAEVRVPPGPFLQASREAGSVLVALVKEGVGRAKRVADLCAGIGTFTFALAGSAGVDAFEEDQAAIAALAQAARGHAEAQAGADQHPRPFPRAAYGAGTHPLRRCRARSAAGRRQVAGRGTRALRRAEGGHGVLQPWHLRAGLAHPCRRRLSHRPRRSRRPILFSPHIELVAELAR